MKIFIFYIFLFLSITKIHSKLPEELRQKLLSKFTKKISLNNLDELELLEDRFISTDSNDLKVSYDFSKISSLLDDYGYPQEYNFLEDINATVRVKDQARCGCCWSHASTSALAYRYQKLGIDVDLSPQHGLSCYLKDCDAGNYLIDPQLNLVKNGTVTEECLPFSSADGKTIEKCPATCKDGSPMKKYYSQNAYMTQDYYSDDYFYDIILIIIDQLNTNGPVVSAIKVYGDFVDWHNDPIKCHNEIYSYDGKSELYGGHAVTIVGYGFINNQFYWLIQNSWGQDTCDKGFVKVEFGQIGVENIAFSEPYIPEEGITPINLTVSFDSIDSKCNMKVHTTSSYEKWQNSLDLLFKLENGSKDFNFQCSTTSMPLKGKELKCYYQRQNYFANKGVYQLVGSNSLGDNNNFILDDSFNKISFTYYGIDTIMPIFPYYQYFFISEEGDRIAFYYESENLNQVDFSPIYPSVNDERALSNCHKVNFNLNGEDTNLIYCDITKDEIDYFDYYNNDDGELVYNYLCGLKVTTYTMVYKLNKDVSPLFRIQNLIIPGKSIITKYDKFILVSTVEGKSSFNEAETFDVLINIEKNGYNNTYLLECSTGIPQIGSNNRIVCFINTDKSISLGYDNIYLLPFSFPYRLHKIYQILINDTIKGITDDPTPEPEPKPSISYFLKLSIFLVVSILFLF